MTSNTVHGSGGTDFTVSPAGEGWIVLASQGSRSGLPGWSGSLTVEESQKLRLLLEEAEIEAALKPSKADRIRKQVKALRDNLRISEFAYQDILNVLDEDGDL